MQIVRAIGKPPPGSPFEKEPLPNAVVFSIKGMTSLPRLVVCTLRECCPGDRPVPSKIGGGDLDGDIVSDRLFNIPSVVHSEIQYNIASLSDLPIQWTYQAAPYNDAPKKILGRKCTMDDVADFVTEYINSDVSVFCTGLYHRSTFRRFWVLSRSTGGSLQIKAPTPSSTRTA